MLESVVGLGLPQDPLDPQGRKGCCAALYQSEPVRLLLGETLHPGGLALTHRLAKLVNIQRGDLVLDLACGRGTSAMAVSRSFHCRVVGIDLGLDGIAEARRLAKDTGIENDVSFLRGDGERLPFGAGPFDATLCECSMSLFPDKKQGVAEIARLLRPGGRLGVSDVTVEPGRLPDELKGTVGQMLCLADAPPVEGYRELLSSDGLSLTHLQDASDSILKLLAGIEGKLATLRLLQRVQGEPTDGSDLISQALSVIDQVKALVNDGAIGYWIFVAEKSARSQRPS